MESFFSTNDLVQWFADVLAQVVSTFAGLKKEGGWEILEFPIERWVCSVTGRAAVRTFPWILIFRFLMISSYLSHFDQSVAVSLLDFQRTLHRI